MKSTKIIGLTGGIGSGKSSVANLLLAKGFSVYFADIEAKKIMQTDKEVIENIQKTFGNESYKAGVLQTEYLAKIVFQDSEALQKLNLIVHPAVRTHLKKFVLRSRKPMIIVENAILFESGFDQLCDEIICVTAYEPTRINRVMQRDHVSREQVLARLSKQWDEPLKVKKSQYIIYNNLWEETQRQVAKLIITLTHKYLNSRK